MKHQKYPNILAISMALLALALPRSGLAGQFGWDTNGNGTVTITGYFGPGGNVVIPSAITNQPVTAIGYHAFLQKLYVTGVTIPDTVTTIGEAAFADSGLTRATIGNGIISLGKQAFGGCFGLTNVTFAGNSLTSIGDDAFAGDEALLWNGLKNLAIPNSVTNIGLGAFEDCSSLTSVVIPGSIADISAGAFEYCSGLTSLAIGDGVTNIDEWAFEYCSGLTSVTIPDSVTNIGYEAFMDCSNLASVTIGDGITNWNMTAFDGCSGLTNITVNKANPIYASAGGVLFNKALTTLIQCPEGLAGSYAMPGSVTNVEVEAFHNCSGLTKVTIPSGAINVGTYAFLDCTNLHQMFFQGNAPSVNGGPGSVDSTVFQGESGTVYYLPGSTGWGATFGGWPTAVWYQPWPQILESSLEAQGNRFQFIISWATNAAVVVEASTNLQNWTPVITNTLVNGTNLFLDSDWTYHPQRFYRVRSQ